MANQPLKSTVEIVESPFRISRLLGLLPDARPYLANWLTVKVTVYQTLDDAGQVIDLKTPAIDHRTELVVLTVEPDGQVKIWGAMGEAIPAEWHVALGYQPPRDTLLSPVGYKQAIGGETDPPVIPDPARLFGQLVDIFDCFLDLSFGVVDQRGTAELLALYVMATWVSDAFATFPYLWPNGDKGAGKTKTLGLVGRLSYLGQVILAGGSYAALRDLAEYGATLCFDDAENLSDPKKSDPDKRALLLAGNRKGAFVPIKEPEGKNGWRIRNVSAYAPKAFSAIRMPDAVLARRTIVVPLVRSSDPDKANHDIEEDRYWPHNRRELVDGLWLFGLHYLPSAREAYSGMASTTLTGPGFEPWRPLFATAQIVEAAGVDNLLDRMRKLATAYQAEKADFEFPDVTRIAVMAISEIGDVGTLGDIRDITYEGVSGTAEMVEFTASDVAKLMNRIAVDEGLVEEDEPYTSARKIGRTLDQLRIRKARKPGGNRTRLRSITRHDALKLYRAYGLGDVSEGGDTPLNQTSLTSQNVPMSPPESAIQTNGFTTIERDIRAWLADDTLATVESERGARDLKQDVRTWLEHIDDSGRPGEYARERLTETHAAVTALLEGMAA